MKTRLVKNESKTIEGNKMEKNQKHLNVPDPSAICGDGSCGCGCDDFVGSKKILSKEELQKIRDSSDRETPAATGTFTERKGVEM
jgi:hypothetical protein